MFVQGLKPLGNDLFITGKLCLCLVVLGLFLCLCFHLKGLIANFHRNFIKYSLKARPIVSFLFAKNGLIIERDLKTSNVGKEDVFFGQLIVVLVFLLLDGHEVIRDFVGGDYGGV